jgi:DNA-binding transcriptional regulator YiaG
VLPAKPHLLIEPTTIADQRGVLNIREWIREKMTTTEFRTKHNLSQADLARLLPVSVRTLQDWESERGRGRVPAFLPRALRDLDRELKKKK